MGCPKQTGQGNSTSRGGRRPRWRSKKARVTGRHATTGTAQGAHMHAPTQPPPSPPYRSVPPLRAAEPRTTRHAANQTCRQSRQSGARAHGRACPVAAARRGGGGVGGGPTPDTHTAAALADDVDGVCLPPSGGAWATPPRPTRTASARVPETRCSTTTPRGRLLRGKGGASAFRWGAQAEGASLSLSSAARPMHSVHTTGGRQSMKAKTHTVGGNCPQLHDLPLPLLIPPRASGHSPPTTNSTTHHATCTALWECRAVRVRTGDPPCRRVP